MDLSEPLVELHQHLDGSIPPRVQWDMMRANDLNPVEDYEQMERLLVMQPEEEGTLLAYLNKFHYPLWITQFYENIREVTIAVLDAAYRSGVRQLELRYAPIIHTYGGLTLRHSLRAVLSGMNAFVREHADFRTGVIVIAMRQHGPHIAKILARQAISEAQHLHERCAVIGFDIAGMERGNPPHLFAGAYEIARQGRLGLTAHAGEDEEAKAVWQAIDELGVQRIGHGCAAVADPELLRRLARDGTVMECCLTSNHQTGAVAAGAPQPLVAFLEAGVRVALCCDNTTVSDTDLQKESARAAAIVGWDVVRDIHRAARDHSFLNSTDDDGERSTSVAPQPPPPPSASRTERT